MSDIKNQLDELAKRTPKEKQLKHVSCEPSQVERITWPESMTPSQVLKHVEQFMFQQEEEVKVWLELEAYPLDGAHALALTLKEIFGWANLKPTPGFFGSNPPVMVEAPISPYETVQVPWGRMKIPNVSGYIDTVATMNGMQPNFVMSGVVQRKDEKIIHELGKEVKARLESDSLYRGKAFRIRFRDQHDNRIEEPNPLDKDLNPTFIDTSRQNLQEMVFPEETSKLLETCLWNPIIYSEQCRRDNIPLKRGVMLEGPYGTGKTLAAHATAALCEANGWTFIYIEDVRDLELGLGVARCYEPAVVFAEDVNRVVTQTRDSNIDHILNTLDGVATKGSEIITVLTTNEVDEIHQAMIRPGRIDTVVPVRSPDLTAGIKLVQVYGRGTVTATEEELAEVLTPLIERKANAAVFREVIERAKLAALPTGGAKELTAAHIETAALSMANHLDLLNKKIPKEKTSMERFGHGVGMQLTNAIENIAANNGRALREEVHTK